MTPKTSYQRDISQRGFSKDPAQAEAVQHLQNLYEQLVAPEKSSLMQSLQRVFSKAKEPVRGLYFWGGVGRGKTWLMDTFYNCLPFDDKLRMHFHHFMRRVHAELKTLEGQKNPLTIVADRLASEARVICFDEFFVSDITDAMILGSLMEQLFSRGVTLVATSNVVPDLLYKDGLQRARFLPAIALLQKHTIVVNVDGGTDYRLRLLEKAHTYHWPLNQETRQKLEKVFQDLAPDPEHIEQSTAIEIAGRAIQSVKLCKDVAWFTFAALCDGPRSQNDYIELACLYHTVILQDVLQFDASRNDQARRFINLIDEFYDRGVKLIVSSEVELEALYTSGTLSFEFQRTLSRLQEMQSKEYLARPHKL
ncbi:cell division protein ZapE [uncultured Endozoicomonas sp.]|uniref:cell division protein ZapE n=1 Tax=uncultured Endozoicomonas sp. TaxID=432652 RepID=UPI00261FAA10|nr:cell division protein ZapE [uncultured Endozoicomonas sp.]